MTGVPVVVRQTEKPSHYNYLKSFRVEQCNDFVNFQCSKHKPFSCFKWHFPNQRRRRPIVNRQGKLNYSVNQYCSKYDEFTGVCPDKDACPLMHKNVGDTENLYHLKNYKVEFCSGTLNNQGNCEKNGVHCAFAHGAGDLRQPVLDVNDRVVAEGKPVNPKFPAKTTQQQTGEVLAAVTDEGIWNDSNYLINNFKTKGCSSISAHNASTCPYYHSSNERRRCPRLFSYSPVLCPKGEMCDSGDSCKNSHNHYESIYHPETFRLSVCTMDYAHNSGTCPFQHSSQQSSKPSKALSLSSSLNDPSSSVEGASGEGGVEEGGVKEGSPAEHLYDVLDAISDYKISHTRQSGNNHGVSHNDTYTTAIGDIPFTNNIAFINPCGVIGGVVPEGTDKMPALKQDIGLYCVNGDDDAGDQVHQPPGFEKKKILESKELSKLRAERDELAQRLSQEVFLKQAALGERDKALCVLDSFKVQPQQHAVLQHLKDHSRLDKLSLCCIFKLHTRLTEDIAKLNKAMEHAQGADERRCSKCHNGVGRMTLSCGHHSYCYRCYIAQVACPQCSLPVFNY